MVWNMPILLYFNVGDKGGTSRAIYFMGWSSLWKEPLSQPNPAVAVNRLPLYCTMFDAVLSHFLISESSDNKNDCPVIIYQHFTMWINKIALTPNHLQIKTSRCYTLHTCTSFNLFHWVRLEIIAHFLLLCSLFSTFILGPINSSPHGKQSCWAL